MIFARSTPSSRSELIVAFFGLVGPNGVMPRHYTELLLRLERDAKHADKKALRDWFDLFTHRLLSFFYRAWEKYRFYIPYERAPLGRTPARPVHARPAQPLRPRPGHAPQPDSRHATSSKIAACFSRRRWPASKTSRFCTTPGSWPAARATPPGWPRCSPTTSPPRSKVRQFQGQWLTLDPADQTALGTPGGNCLLGDNVVIGERVWDVAGKIRMRIGPLRYAQFVEFLPDRTAAPRGKAFFLLSHLTRLFIGPTLTFDVQLLLRADDVPECILGAAAPPGSRLGWNTWLRSPAKTGCADDAVFDGQEVFNLTGRASSPSP